MAQMKRAEHLDWAKQRAFEYLDMNDASRAFTSFCSDMEKHPDCGIALKQARTGMALAAVGDVAGMRRWIEQQIA